MTASETLPNAFSALKDPLQFVTACQKHLLLAKAIQRTDESKSQKKHEMLLSWFYRHNIYRASYDFARYSTILRGKLDCQ